jgi:1-acyl-sn-glycerol-3-phosphate acyltransferase
MLEILKRLFKICFKLHLLHILLHIFMFGYFIYFKIKNNLQVVGAENLPAKNREPFIAAINHSSGADAYFGLALIGGRYGRWGSFVAHERSFQKDTLEKWFLLALGGIPRIGSGQRVINRMAYWLCRNRNIYIVPEGMYSTKVMRGYTGIMRVYWLANHLRAKHGHGEKSVPIMPVAAIGASKAYPAEMGADGKYHPQKGGVVIHVGKPITFDLPEKATKEWYREKTDEVMNIIAKLALQKEGVIDSWKLKSLQEGPRNYKL